MGGCLPRPAGLREGEMIIIVIAVVAAVSDAALQIPADRCVSKHGKSKPELSFTCRVEKLL